MAQSAAEEGGAEGRIAPLGSHVDIFVDRPLADLSTPYASAYVARDRELPTVNICALVCNPQVAPRLEVLEALRGMRLDGMLTPLEWGVIEWPLAARRCFAIVYDRPLGGPAMPGYGGMGEPTLVTPLRGWPHEHAEDLGPAGDGRGAGDPARCRSRGRVGRGARAHGTQRLG